jgi:phage tail tape-measure protein
MDPMKQKPKAAKKLKKSRPKSSKLGVINVKATAAERQELKRQARKHLGGNLSGWLRLAGRRYTPTKSEIAALKAGK